MYITSCSWLSVGQHCKTTFKGTPKILACCKKTGTEICVQGSTDTLHVGTTDLI
jgi:hypothetical protein